MALEFEHIGEVDLMKTLYFDTFLSVKMDKKGGGGTLFVNYIIPVKRRNETERVYGDIVCYFRRQNRFRFARGFLLNKTDDGELWVAKRQYLYFDRNRATFEDKELGTYLYHPVRKRTAPKLDPTAK